MCLPATAEPEGYTAEKSNGNIKTIPAHAVFTCEFEFGALEPAQAKATQSMIESLAK